MRTVSGVFKHLTQGLEPLANSTIEGLPGPSERRRSSASAVTVMVDSDGLNTSITCPEGKVN